MSETLYQKKSACPTFCGVTVKRSSNSIQGRFYVANLLRNEIFAEAKLLVAKYQSVTFCSLHGGVCYYVIPIIKFLCEA